MPAPSDPNQGEPILKRVIISTALRILAFVYLGISFVVFILPFWIPPIEIKEEHKPFYDSDIYNTLLPSQVISEIHRCSDSLRELPVVTHEDYINSLLSSVSINMISETDSFLKSKFGIDINSFNTNNDTIAIFNSISHFLQTGKKKLSVFHADISDTETRKEIKSLIDAEHNKVIQEIHDNAQSNQTGIHYKFIIIGALVAGIFIYLGFGDIHKKRLLQESEANHDNTDTEQDNQGEISNSEIQTNNANFLTFREKLEGMFKAPGLVLLLSIIFTVSIIIDIQIKNKVIGADSAGLWIKNYVEPLYSNARAKPYGRFLPWEHFLRLKDDSDGTFSLGNEICRIEFIKNVVGVKESSLTEKRLFIFMLQENTLKQEGNYGYQSSPKFSFSKWVPQHALSFVVYIVIMFLVIQCIIDEKIYWDNKYIHRGLFLIHIVLLSFAFLNHSIPSAYEFKNSCDLLKNAVGILKLTLIISLVLNMLCLIFPNRTSNNHNTKFNYYYVILTLVMVLQIFGIVFIQFKGSSWNIISNFFMFVVGVLYCINLSIILFYDNFENKMYLTRQQDNTNMVN